MRILLCIGMMHSIFNGNAFAAESKSPISFLSLTPNQTIRIDWESSGCFHDQRSQIDFVPGNPVKLLISNLKRDRKHPDLWKVEQRFTRKLVSYDPKKWEAELAAYRKLPRGGSTTTETVQFTLMENGNPLKSESFTDSSSLHELISSVVVSDEEISRQSKVDHRILMRDESHASLIKRLNAIILPEIHFDNMPIEAVAAQLSRMSKAVDPRHEGVRIILDTRLLGPTLNRNAPRKSLSEPWITLHLPKVPLLTAIKYVCNVSGLECDFTDGEVHLNGG